MLTQIIDPSCLDKALQSLREAVPIAFPTETVYGLGAAALDPIAVKKIFDIKGRPSDNPLIVHIHSLSQLSDLVEEVPPSFFLLAEQFWPGPLTLIAKRKKTVPAIVSAGQETIAIRMPSHPIARNLIERFGAPLAAPSANLSGRPSPTTARDVFEDLNGKIPWIVDGGPCEVGIESTVLNLVASPPVLLRPGSISKEAIERVLGSPIDLPGEDAPLLSPGMKYRHYAPKAKVKLIFDLKEVSGEPLLSDITSRTLYASLREADRLGMREVSIFCDGKIQADAALMNRLLRAAN